jgi:NitT/TauT family transport system substrate-binding protein
MHDQRAEGWTRRAFLGGVTLAGTAGLLGLHPGLVAAEPPPETTRIRLVQTPSMCQAPQYVAEELLRSEGFTEVVYLKKEGFMRQLRCWVSQSEVCGTLYVYAQIQQACHQGQ